MTTFYHYTVLFLLTTLGVVAGQIEWRVGVVASIVGVVLVAFHGALEFL